MRVISGSVLSCEHTLTSGLGNNESSVSEPFGRDFSPSVSSAALSLASSASMTGSLLEQSTWLELLSSPPAVK